MRETGCAEGDRTSEDERREDEAILLDQYWWGFATSRSGSGVHVGSNLGQGHHDRTQSAERRGCEETRLASWNADSGTPAGRLSASRSEKQTGSDEDDEEAYGEPSGWVPTCALACSIICMTVVVIAPPFLRFAGGRVGHIEPAAAEQVQGSRQGV